MIQNKTDLFYCSETFKKILVFETILVIYLIEFLQTSVIDDLI